MNIVTEELQINKIVCASKTQKVIEGDIIVPDIKPDILKLLQTDALIFINEKRINDGGFDIEGRVELALMYIPDSENERIKSITTSFDFGESITNKEINADDRLIVNGCIEKVECTPINSRKLKIRVVVGIEYEALRVEELPVAIDTEDCENAQIRRETISLQNSVDVCEQSFVLRERAEISAGQESINELLKYDVKISDTEYKALDSKVVVKGAVCVCILYTGLSGSIEFSETEMQFTEVVECEGMNEDCCCDIDFSVADFKLAVEEDNDGDMRIADIEALICVQLKAVMDMEVDMIADCYEPYKTTVPQKKKMLLDEVVSRPQTQNTIREIIEASPNMPTVSGVYDVIAKPYVTSAKISDGKLLCEGNLEVFVLYISENIENPIHNIRKEIPFSYMLDARADEESLIPQIKTEVKHISYNLNAAGEIELRAVIGVNANVVRQSEIDLITSVDTVAEKEVKSSDITIYFVQNGDTLWEVAKRYKAPVEDIIEFNSLKDDKIKTGARLLIPGK